MAIVEQRQTDLPGTPSHCTLNDQATSVPKSMRPLEDTLTEGESDQIGQMDRDPVMDRDSQHAEYELPANHEALVNI